MASFALFPGKLNKSKIFNPKYLREHRDQVTAVDTIGLFGDELYDLKLSHDGFTNGLWEGPQLEKMRAELESAISGFHDEVTKKVLEKAHRRAVESWLGPAIREEASKHHRLQLAKSILGLVERAMAENGIIVYWGD